MVCRFLPVSVPDHDGGTKRNPLSAARNFRDDNRIQGLLNLADCGFDLSQVGFRCWPGLVAPGRQSLLHFEQVAQALFQPGCTFFCDVLPGARWKLRADGGNLFRAGIII
jgi:hypothetical protein